MTLTAEQQAKRAGKLTASRIAVLMTGDEAGIMRLYQELIGEIPPENLDDVWAVQLGAVTEKLNLDWFERKNNCILKARGEVIQHRTLSWAAATLDGYWIEGCCVVECKHVGGREPIETLIDRYQPQMQWQMECTVTTRCALSVIMGANEPIVEFVDRDTAYTFELVARAKSFMACVQMRIPPLEMAPLPPPANATKIRDMEGNNVWANHAEIWIGTRRSSEINKDSEKILKRLVQPEDKKCFGHGVQITRDRAGRLSLRPIRPD
jgi:hypothetical protein